MGQRDSHRGEAEGRKALVAPDSGPAVGTVARTAGKWETGKCLPSRVPGRGRGKPAEGTVPTNLPWTDDFSVVLILPSFVNNWGDLGNPKFLRTQALRKLPHPFKEAAGGLRPLLLRGFIQPA